MLREWRVDRRRSQMALALDVGVSTRHLSYVETGKSKPSPELFLAVTRDPRLRSLLDEVTGYPNVVALGRSWRTRREAPSIVVPLRLRVGHGTEQYTQAWFSTNTTIGTPVDVTLDELHVELFHPADEATAAIVGGRTA